MECQENFNYFSCEVKWSGQENVSSQFVRINKLPEGSSLGRSEVSTLGSFPGLNNYCERASGSKRG